MRQINSKGAKLIQRFEGCKLSAYKCPAGVWTIGYGHTQGVKQGMKISLEQAQQLLIGDLRRFCAGVDSLTQTLNLSDDMFAALVCFAYNVGLGNFSTSTLLKKVKADKTDKSIINEFLRWNKAGGQALAGLTARREAEAKLYFSAQ